MAEDRSFYVYVADHPVTGEPIYVGKGKGRRFAQHNPAAMAGKHVNRYLTNVIKKYGPVAFVIVQNGLTENEAFALERELIAKYGRVDIGTGTLSNRTDGGDGTTGYKHTAEWVAACREWNKRRVLTPESRARMSAASKGRKASAETRAKLSAFQRSRPKPSAETIRKMVESQRGRTYSVETRAKMSAARRGSKHSDDHKQKIGAALRGKVHSAESISNMREGQRQSAARRLVVASDLFAWAEMKETKRLKARKAATERERIRATAARQKLKGPRPALSDNEAGPASALSPHLALQAVSLT